MLGRAWKATYQAGNTGSVKSVRVSRRSLQIFLLSFLITSEEIEIIEPTEQDFRINIFNIPTAYEIILFL